VSEADALHDGGTIEALGVEEQEHLVDVRGRSP